MDDDGVEVLVPLERGMAAGAHLEVAKLQIFSQKLMFGEIVLRIQSNTVLR